MHFIAELCTVARVGFLFVLYDQQYLRYTSLVCSSYCYSEVETVACMWHTVVISVVCTLLLLLQLCLWHIP